MDACGLCGQAIDIHDYVAARDGQWLHLQCKIDDELFGCVQLRLFEPRVYETEWIC